MTRDDIIRMALEAGFSEPNPHDGYMGLAYDYRDGTDTGASLERFADLVAAAERKALEDMDWTWLMRQGALVTWGDAETLGDRVIAAIRARGQA